MKIKKLAVTEFLTQQDLITAVANCKYPKTKIEEAIEKQSLVIERDKMFVVNPQFYLNDLYTKYITETHDAMHAWSNLEFRRIKDGIKLPAALFQAGKSPATEDTLGFMKRFSRDMTIQIFPNSSHYIHKDDPVEFVKSVDAFMKKVNELNHATTVGSW